MKGVEHALYFSIYIYMFHNDHFMPHFHAYYGEEGATINLHTLEVMEGKLSQRALRLVKEWAELHHGELLRNWELARNKETLMKIEPLE